MRYKTVKDILYDVYASDEIKAAGLGGFFDATDRLHDDRPHPEGITQRETDRINSDDSTIPSAEKTQKFKRLVREFVKANPKCSIYQDTNELEHCAIRFLYY